MALLDDVKQNLRIKISSLDGEVENLIEACKLDMSISGVSIINETDELVKRAIIIYCKANFGIDNKDSEKYQRAYDLLKEHLALTEIYN